MSRGPWLAAVAGLVVVGAGAAGFALLQPGAATSEEPSSEKSTAAVERRTLRVVEEANGQLGHGTTQPVFGQLPGTLTEAADVGDTVERGETLFSVDDQPVALLYGELPVWRPIGPRTTGRDVLQLEENLVELGYADLTPDETFDADTTAAVKAWQKASGMVEDGVVNLGEVVFLPDAVWVAEQQVMVGGRVGPGAPVMAVASTDRLVTLDLPAAQRDDVAEGDELDVELSDGTMTSGTVESVGTTLTTDPQSGSQTVKVTIRLDGDTEDVSDGPVTVSIVRQERTDVLAVPVNALLALLEGGYAVEVLTDEASGATSLVGVEVGLFADGWVEITETTSGELAEGDLVVVP